MIIGVTTNRLCVCHLGEIYYGEEAIEIVREYGTDDNIVHAEYINATCIVKSKEKLNKSLTRST